MYAHNQFSYSQSVMHKNGCVQHQASVYLLSLLKYTGKRKCKHWYCFTNSLGLCVANICS